MTHPSTPSSMCDSFVLMAFYLKPGHGDVIPLFERLEAEISSNPKLGRKTKRFAFIPPDVAWLPEDVPRRDHDSFEEIDYGALEEPLRRRLGELEIDALCVERGRTGALPRWGVEFMAASNDDVRSFDSTVSIAIELDALQNATQGGRARDVIDRLVGCVVESGMAFSGHAETLSLFESPSLQTYCCFAEYGRIPPTRDVDRALWCANAPRREPGVLVRGVFWGNWYTPEILARLDPDGVFLPWFEARGAEAGDSPVNRFDDGSALLTLADAPDGWKWADQRVREMTARLHRQLRATGLIP